MPDEIRALLSFRRMDSIFRSSGDKSGLIEIPGFWDRWGQFAKIEETSDGLFKEASTG